MDRSVVSPPKSSWLVKFIESFIVVGLVYTAYVLSLMAPKGWRIVPTALSIAFLAALFIAFFYSVNWHNKELSGAFDSSKRHSVLRGVMRYWLAFHISFYGYAKLMDTQLFQDVLWNNTPTGKLSGLELTRPLEYSPDRYFLWDPRASCRCNNIYVGSFLPIAVAVEGHCRPLPQGSFERPPHFPEFSEMGDQGPRDYNSGYQYLFAKQANLPSGNCRQMER